MEAGLRYDSLRAVICVLAGSDCGYDTAAICYVVPLSVPTSKGYDAWLSRASKGGSL